MGDHSASDMLVQKCAVHTVQMGSALLTKSLAVQERLMKNDVHYRFSINVLNSIIPA